MSYTQLSAGVRVESSVSLSLSGPGNQETWFNRSNMQMDLRPLPPTDSATTTTTTIQMSICPYARIVPQRSFAFDWLYDVVVQVRERERRVRECRRGKRRLLANLAALYFRLSFILPTDFLCISFCSLRAANMQKCCKRRLRKRKREREGERRLRDRE